MLGVLRKDARTKKIKLLDNNLYANAVIAEIGGREGLDILMLTPQFLSLADVTFVPGRNHREGYAPAGHEPGYSQHLHVAKIFVDDWMMCHAIADG